MSEFVSCQTTCCDILVALPFLCNGFDKNNVRKDQSWSIDNASRRAVVALLEAEYLGPADV